MRKWGRGVKRFLNVCATVIVSISPELRVRIVSEEVASCVKQVADLQL